jgi:hypothetical protein
MQTYQAAKGVPPMAFMLYMWHAAFLLVYRLIELALLLPVATISLEMRAFSAMNIIKTDLCNKIGDEWLNDLMICFTDERYLEDLTMKKL